MLENTPKSWKEVYFQRYLHKLIMKRYEAPVISVFDNVFSDPFIKFPNFAVKLFLWSKIEPQYDS